MRLLTKLELDKLIRRKYLLLGGLLLLGYSSFMFFSCCMNSSPTFPVETADGVEVTGRAAALYNKSVYEQYAGELTDEAVAHVLDDFVDLRDAHGEHSFNWPVIYDNFSIFRAADQADRKRSEYGYISVADAGVLSFHSPLPCYEVSSLKYLATIQISCLDAFDLVDITFLQRSLKF